VLADVRSVVMVGMEYSHCGLPIVRNGPLQRAVGPAKAGHYEQFAIGAPARAGHPQSAMAKIARYARGPDYHDVLRGKLKTLLGWVQTQRPACHGRAVVDTAPLLERDFARRAGLGWIGKNTMLINKHRGSYLFLGALLTNLELKPDPPHEASHCGTCTACLDACPTEAFVAPGSLDARRCISYLTIELRGPVPEELRPGVGDWLFGCDVCQEVCPWNGKPPAVAFPSNDDLQALDPIELLGLTEEEFRRRFRGTAITRTKR